MGTYGNFPQRIKMLNEALGTIVIFLDEDTLLKDPEFIQRVMALVEKNPKMKIFGGLYEDHPEGLWSDRAYNFICNMWVLMAARPVSTEIFQTKQLLGGCIVVNKENLDLGGIFDPPFWGGEDTFFFRQAQAKGISLHFSPKINVRHPCGGNLSKWIKRAYRHGKHGVLFGLNCRENYKLQNIFAFKRYWFEILIFSPAISLHFSIVYFGSLVGSIRRIVDRLKFPGFNPNFRQPKILESRVEESVF